MKTFLPVLASLVLFYGCSSGVGTSGSIRYNTKQVLTTASDDLTWVVNGDTLRFSNIPFSETHSDTFPLFYLADELIFSAYSGIDSLHLRLGLNQESRISVVKEGMQPLLIIIHNGIERQQLSFDTRTTDLRYGLVYNIDPEDTYLKTLRERYGLDELVAAETTQLGKVRAVSAWVQGLWKHNGWNVPPQSDALSILEDVTERGARYRCVEYGIVTAACLNALGLPSRTLGLKRQDVQTASLGAGHVVMETWLSDLEKWVMVDPQFDAVVLSGGVPLNAVELQQAVTENGELEIATSNPTTNLASYLPFVYPYLYYFDVKFDNREGVPSNDRLRIDGKSSLMLVPLDATQPTVFQQTSPLNYLKYTRSTVDFYAKPIV